MTYLMRWMVLVAAFGLSSTSRTAAAQTAPEESAPAPAAAAPPAAAPAPITLPVPPPGYMLVPIHAAHPGASARPTEPPEPSAELEYDPSQPIPPGYRVKDRMRRGLVIGGSITLGVAWTLSALVAADETENSTDLSYLAIPVVGPWMTLASGAARSGCSSDICSDNSDLRVMLLLDGLAQAAGAVMLTTGLFYPTQRLVRSDFRMSVAPTPIGRDGYGLGAVGAF